MVRILVCFCCDPFIFTSVWLQLVLLFSEVFMLVICWFICVFIFWWLQCALLPQQRTSVRNEAREWQTVISSDLESGDLLLLKDRWKLNYRNWNIIPLLDFHSQTIIFTLFNFCLAQNWSLTLCFRRREEGGTVFYK